MQRIFRLGRILRDLLVQCPIQQKSLLQPPDWQLCHLLLNTSLPLLAVLCIVIWFWPRRVLYFRIDLGLHTNTSRCFSAFSPRINRRGAWQHGNSCLRSSCSENKQVLTGKPCFYKPFCWNNVCFWGGVEIFSQVQNQLEPGGYWSKTEPFGVQVCLLLAKHDFLFFRRIFLKTHKKGSWGFLDIKWLLQNSILMS